MRSKTRLYLGWIFILLAFVIWIPSSDVIDLIVRQKEIVFGRYSRGQFGSLSVLTMLLLGLSALCFSKIKSTAELVLVGVMVTFSTVISGFVLVVGSGLFSKPRYVEEQQAAGIIRHAQPN